MFGAKIGLHENKQQQKNENIQQTLIQRFCGMFFFVFICSQHKNKYVNIKQYNVFNIMVWYQGKKI